MGGGDERFEAHSADHLFEGCVVTAGGDERGAHRNLRRVFEIFACQPAQAQSGARCRLQKQRADMRFFLTAAAYLDRIMGFGVGILL